MFFVSLSFEGGDGSPESKRACRRTRSNVPHPAEPRDRNKNSGICTKCSLGPNSRSLPPWRPSIRCPFRGKAMPCLVRVRPGGRVAFSKGTPDLSNPDSRATLVLEVGLDFPRALACNACRRLAPYSSPAQKGEQQTSRASCPQLLPTVRDIRANTKRHECLRSIAKRREAKRGARCAGQCPCGCPQSWFRASPARERSGSGGGT